MFRVFLSLGSNLGDRLDYLQKAVEEVSKIAHVRSLSSVYETEPVENKDQPDFLNMVMEVSTSSAPQDFLKKLKIVEKTVGRKNTKHLAPREIDIDILLYEGLSYKDKNVTVPHSKLHCRRFVLKPLNEIAAEVRLPGSEQTVSSLLLRCPDVSRVNRTASQQSLLVSQLR